MDDTNLRPPQGVHEEMPPALDLLVSLATFWADGSITERGIARTLLAFHDKSEALASRLRDEEDPLTEGRVSGLDVAKLARRLRKEDPDHGDTRAGRPVTTNAPEPTDRADPAPGPLEAMVAEEELHRLHARIDAIMERATPAQRRALERLARGETLSSADRNALYWFRHNNSL